MNVIYQEKKFSIFEDSLDVKGLLKTHSIKLSEISTIESSSLMKTISIQTKNKKKYSIQIPLLEYFEETVNFLQGKSDSNKYSDSIKELDLEKPELEKKYKKKRTYIILGIIFFFVILIVVGSNSEPEIKNNQDQIQKVDQKENLESEAYTLTQIFVTRLLKSPSTADFPWLDRTVTEMEENKFKVTSYVDSQNGFGAMIRTNYSIILKYDGVGDTLSESSWDIVELYIDGEKII